MGDQFQNRRLPAHRVCTNKISSALALDVSRCDVAAAEIRRGATRTWAASGGRCGASPCSPRSRSGPLLPDPACPSMSQHVPICMFPRPPYYPPMAAGALSCRIPRPHHSSRAGFLHEHADLLAVGKRLLDGVYCCHRRERSIPSHWQSAVGCRKAFRDDHDPEDDASARCACV